MFDTLPTTTDDFIRLGACFILVFGGYYILRIVYRQPVIYWVGLYMYTPRQLWVAAFTSDMYYDCSKKEGLYWMEREGNPEIIRYHREQFDSYRGKTIRGYSIDANITDNFNGTATIEVILTDKDGIHEYISFNPTYLHLQRTSNVFHITMASKIKREESIA